MDAGTSVEGGIAPVTQLDNAYLSKSISLWIDLLDIDYIRPIRPLHILVEPYGDGFVATFPQANIAMSGDTQQEAVENLKESISELFEFLEEMSDSQLGAAMRKQKSVLCSVLKRQAQQKNG